MNDHDFVELLTGELAALPNVIAVALGGSRARGTHRPDSDWDFAIYYRGVFDPGALRARGWNGQVSEVGGWGGGVMNGGAWLSIDDRRVDIHYRDIAEVLHWCNEADVGRFEKELLLFYSAGIPTYVVMGELALNVVLAGELPRPQYPPALAESAGLRWQRDALASLVYAKTAIVQHGDVVTALSNVSRGIIECAHGRLAQRRTWVLNEKGLAEAAGLVAAADLLLAASTRTALTEAIERVAALVQT